MAVTITDEQRTQLDEQGFTLVNNLFTCEEMDELATHIEAIQQKHEDAIREKGGTEGISRANEITFTAFLAESDDYIKSFCQRPEFVDISTQLLGSDVDLYWNQAVFKMPEGEQQFPWHQDDGYTPVYQPLHPNANTVLEPVFALVGGN